MQQSATQLLKHADTWATDTHQPKLTPYERFIVTNAALGQPTILPGNPDPRQDLNQPCPPKPDPEPLAEENHWTPDRTINPRLIRWLLENKYNLVHHFGVFLVNARFKDLLDLEMLRTDRDLWLARCRLNKGMNLNDAQLQGLVLHQCAALETIGAMRCTIRGQLSLSGSMLSPAKGIALNLQRAAINGGAFFGLNGSNRFESTGTIHAHGVTINGSLSFSGARLSASDGDCALNLEGATIKSDAVFRTKEGMRFKSRGTINAAGISIAGQLDFSGAILTPRLGDIALNLQCATIEGSVFFRPAVYGKRVIRFRSTGPIYCHSAHFKSVLLLESAKLAASGNFALNLNQAVVEGDTNLGRYTKDLQPVKVQGCIDAQRAHFRGDLNMHGIHVSCPGARIANAEEDGPTAAINLFGAKIDGALRLTPSAYDDQKADPPKIIGPIDLRSAHVGRLADFVTRDAPKPLKPRVINDDGSEADFDGPLWRIDGLTYDCLGHNVAFKPEHRLAWLDHDKSYRTGDEYQPQPFEQLAKVLREEGHESAARTIAYKKQNRRRSYADLSKHSRAWAWVLWATVGYGYRVQRAFYELIALFLIGSAIFFFAPHAEAVAPNTPILWSQLDRTTPPPQQILTFDLSNLPDEHYQFDGFLYSLDTLIPLFDIGQERAWRIQPNRLFGWGWWFRFYEVIHIGLGWILTTLLAVGLTGALKKD